MALCQHSARPSATSAEGIVPSGETARRAPGPGRFLPTGDAVVGTNVVNRARPARGLRTAAVLGDALSAA